MAFPTILIDVDTQFDFVMPEGAWPVPGAAALIPMLERLTRWARKYNLPVLSTQQLLGEGDPRFQPAGECPPHCLKGSEGARKIPATRPEKPVIIENRPRTAAELESLIAGAREMILETSGPDIMSNPCTSDLLSGAGVAFVYGVALDGAVRAAVEALSRLRVPVEVVMNATATRSAEPEAREKILEELASKGVKLIRDIDVMTRFTTERHR